MEHPSSILTSLMPHVSSWFNRWSCAQTLHVLCGSSKTASAALDGPGRGRSAGRGRGRRSLMRCMRAAATCAHACASQSPDPVPLTAILRLLLWRAEGALRRTCARTHPMHLPARTTTPSSSSLNVILRVPAWRPGRVRQGPFSRSSFWRGL